MTYQVLNLNKYAFAHRMALWVFCTCFIQAIEILNVKGHKTVMVAEMFNVDYIAAGGNLNNIFSAFTSNFVTK